MTDRSLKEIVALHLESAEHMMAEGRWFNAFRELLLTERLGHEAYHYVTKTGKNFDRLYSEASKNCVIYYLGLAEAHKDEAKQAYHRIAIDETRLNENFTGVYNNLIMLITELENAKTYAECAAPFDTLSGVAWILTI